MSGELLFAREIRRLELAAAGARPPLMERAGRAVAECAARLAVDTGAPVLVVAGPGNNGGDAWVAAAHLRESFHKVIVLDAASAEPDAPEARSARERFLSRGGSAVAAWPEDLVPALIVDGLLGIGIARDVVGPMAALVERMNAARAPVLAIDVPSGLDADTGAIRGTAVRATRTITFLALKPGLFTGEGTECAGAVELDRLGVALDAAAIHGRLVTPEVARAALMPRRRNAHKGTYGTLGILGGSRGMVGAAILAGRAGLFTGAGRVIVGLLAPEGVPFDPGAPELMLRPTDDVLQADVIIAGPGAGQSPSATSLSAFDRSVLPAAIAAPRPLVLDADALNAIAAQEGLRTEIAAREFPAILTPHPGEAARLLATTSAEVQADRVGAALLLAKRYGAFVVLKGAGSVCASPEGHWSINATGNPGLASGGTGDALAGMIGALLCQGLEARDALACAVCLHGAAADACVARGAGPAGLTASEVILEARALLNRWAAA